MHASDCVPKPLERPHAHQRCLTGTDLANEENLRNNSVLRLVNVDQRKPRILYLEGEPRWEFKFLRRAVEDDRSIDLATMVRTTQNKILFQGDFSVTPGEPANDHVKALVPVLERLNLDFDRYINVHASAAPQSKADVWKAVGK